MTAVLLLTPPEPSPDAFPPGMDEAMRDATTRCTCHDVVQCVAQRAPDQVVLVVDAWSEALAAALSAWAGRPPCPVTLVAPPMDVADARAAVESGVHHWLAPASASPGQALAGALAWARARDARARRLQDERAAALTQLDERKWIDRAKGILMSARGLSEDEAFRLLRGAAMNVNLRLGEISRAVTEAAQWADAVNRAGQLRMLSQRLVRLAAQRLLGIDPKGARALQAESLQRLKENLEMLATACAGTSAQSQVAGTRALADALRVALDAANDPVALRAADERAEALREAADALTEAVEAVAGRRSLHIVNTCGRQRMHVQRAAKCGLLASVDTPHADESLAALQAALDEFESHQRELESAPLTSPQIRESLQAVRDEWLRLLGGLRATDPRDGCRALVHASEVLLGHLDALTAAYEHSLQVIMG